VCQLIRRVGNLVKCHVTDIWVPNTVTGNSLVWPCLGRIHAYPQPKTDVIVFTFTYILIGSISESEYIGRCMGERSTSFRAVTLGKVVATEYIDGNIPFSHKNMTALQRNIKHQVPSQKQLSSSSAVVFSASSDRCSPFRDIYTYKYVEQRIEGGWMAVHRILGYHFRVVQLAARCPFPWTLPQCSDRSGHEWTGDPIRQQSWVDTSRRKRVAEGTVL